MVSLEEMPAQVHSKETRAALLEIAQQLVERGATARRAESPHWWRWVELGFQLAGFVVRASGFVYGVVEGPLFGCLAFVHGLFRG